MGILAITSSSASDTVDEVVNHVENNTDFSSIEHKVYQLIFEKESGVDFSADFVTCLATRAAIQSVQDQDVSKGASVLGKGLALIDETSPSFEIGMHAFIGQLVQYEHFHEMEGDGKVDLKESVKIDLVRNIAKQPQFTRSQIKQLVNILTFSKPYDVDVVKSQRIKM